MSVIGKKPFVNKIIDLCTKEQVYQIISLMNNLGTPTLVALYGDDNLISSSNIGVNYVTLKMNELLAQNINGILVYLDNTHCGFFGISTNSDNIDEFEIDPVNRTFEKVREYLTVEELRQVCGDRVADISIDSATFKPFPESWPTTSANTTAEFCAAVDEDDDAIVGMGYMGGASWSDLPFEGNGDVVVEVLQGPNSTKSIHLILTSGNVAPYHWEYTYWNHGSNSGWITLGGGMPEANAPDKVLVSNSDLEWEETDAVPMADNLTSSPETNDALYSSGPTGGLADIATGEEAYLAEVKGYSIVWNQLMPDYTGTTQYVTTLADHVYIRIYKIGYSNQGQMTLIQNSTTDISNQTYKLFDLTLMFGGNDKIPFSLSSNVTEYPANGGIPAQTYQPTYGFARLFANVDLINAPYDAGTIKNVSVTKLAETGRNLFDNATMDGENGTGLQLLAGYRYEICQGTNYNNDHPSGWSNCVQLSYDGIHWVSETRASLTRYQRADGKYVWTYLPTCNCYIKTPLAWDNNTYKLRFVGFVHSGNYCLTTGDNTNNNYSYSTENIPTYQKHEFNVNVSGLNGIPDTSDNHCSVYDTTDYKRVEKITDLSTLEWTDENNDGIWTVTVNDIKPSTTQLLATKYLTGSFDSLVIGEMAVDENKVLKIRTENHSTLPSGSLLYELAEPISRASTFTPIPLKDSQGNWIVNDMGSEYFIQPENTNCPVNQISTYYLNLKDKLVNLQVPEIKIIDYNTSNELINGLQINENRYRLAPFHDENYNPFGVNYTNKWFGPGKFTYPLSSSCTQNYGVIFNDISTYCSYSYLFGYANVGNGTRYFVTVGYVATGQRAFGVGIGYNASVYGDNAVVIGYYAKTGYSNAYPTSNTVTIGYQSQNRIPDTVSFDGTTNDTQRTIQMYDATKIFFRNDVVHNEQSSYKTFASYTSGHFLKEYIQNNLLANDGTDLTKYYLEYTDANNYKTITGNCASGTFAAIDKLINAVHITLKISGQTSHSVVGLDLLPYDATNSYGFTSYGRVIVDGTVEDITATIDSDGIIVITAPTGATIDEARYNIK